jgi:esterase/lipase
MSNELNGVCELFKVELKNGLIGIFMDKIQEKVKENIEKQLKEYQDKTNKILEKTQKQPNELRENFNKFQKGTKEII